MPDINDTAKRMLLPGIEAGLRKIDEYERRTGLVWDESSGEVTPDYIAGFKDSLHLLKRLAEDGTFNDA